ncbi:putative tripeptidyl aminopeptidase [Streptomyces sp. NBRC 110611]|uniref:alpha/beta hydrolase n=1 Tax=Streptomyces sp. NBRC 110611 TaxID=1621259 RepID=UPI0008573702|nr:alpha/beta hydrolase [Streptomyces sp. NBRC 110611]GAU64835.1 putative tripeptidyl aminopeptidase [Streptomyces sp. NBRC 110611]
MPKSRKPRWTLPALSSALVAAVAATVLPAPAPAVAAQHRAAAPPIPARYTAQRLDWQPCSTASGALLECARMTVPRNWHRPGAGRDLTLSVSRHRATDPARRRGVLMMAAGGPGGQGLERPAGFVAKSPAVAAAYDVVSFDQRGVGKSTQVSCQSDEEFREFFRSDGDLRDRSPAAIRGVLHRARQLAEGCARRSGDLARYITTDQTVRDMDLFRSLLGQRKVSYYGPSYATMIGAYYATEFPQRVERVVLDSNIGFDGTWEEFEKGQPLSFQRRFEQDFLPWLAAHDSVYHYGRTAAEAKATWEARRAALREHPLDLPAGSPAPDGSRSLRLGPNAFDSGAIQAIYKARGFPVLAAALTALEHWDTATREERALVAKLYGSYLSPGFLAEFASVTCGDTPWTGDTGYWVARSAEDTARYPLLGARSLAFAATCAAWPSPPAPRVRVTGKGLPPVLMLNSRHDPATYYEAAVRAHRALRGSRLVTVDGGDHGQYLNGNGCVDRIVDTYLLTGSVPARDTSCPAAPAPAPLPAAHP